MMPVAVFACIASTTPSEVRGTSSLMLVRFAKSPWVLTLLLGFALVTGKAQTEPASPASDSYAQAENLVRAHQWDQGLDALRPVLKRSPRDVKALNLAGLACTGKGDLKQANQYFRQALGIQPGFVPSLKNLGINEFTLHDLPSSEKHLEHALKLEPDDPVVNLYLGEIAYSQQNFKKAAERLQRAGGFLSRDPDVKAHLAVSLLLTGQRDPAVVLLDGMSTQPISAASQFAIGLSLAQTDLPDRAVPYFELLRQHHPDSYNTAFDLLLCYLGTKKYSDVISLANELIAAGHDTDEVEDAVAEAYEKNHDTPRAVAALRRAIELNPQNDDNYLDFANLCIDHRDFDNGLKVIGVGLEARPNSYRLVFERGVLYAMEDRFDLAEQDFRRSANLAPATNFGYVGMGVTYLERGNAAKAIDLLHQRLKQNPNDASLLYLLGEALMRNGAKPGEPQYAEAQSSFEKSIHLNPGLCLPHVALGEIYVDEGRFQDAVNQLEQARAIDPKEKSAYSHLAVAYRRLGDTESARRTLESLKSIYQQEQGWMHNRMKPENDDPAASSQAGPG